jgi:hypothetical protein
MAGILGPGLTAQGYEGAELLLPLVVALILVTVLAHGLTIGPLSRRFGLSAATPDGVLIVGASPWTVGLARALEENEAPVMIVDSSWHRLSAARLGGVKVFLGEIHAEESEQQLELNDFGCLLAASEVDACNALVCSRFADEIGRTRVFQLPDHSSQAPKEKTLPRAVRGLATPADDAWFENLLSKSYAGWEFHTTPLTHDVGFDQWTASVPPGSMATLGLRPDGAVLFNSPEQPVKFQSGDKLVWYGPRQAEHRRSGER